jgi:hypothetical protein
MKTVAILLFSLALRALAAPPSATAPSSDRGLVETALRLNSAVRMSGPVCSGAEPSPGVFQTASISTSREAMCSVLDHLAKDGRPGLFDTQNPYGLCAPVWGQPLPEWTRPSVQASLQTYASADWIAPTRNQYLAQGFKLLTPDARQTILRDALRLREESTKLCCGSDVACTNLMRQVRVEFCTSEADQDPSKQDPCLFSAGVYALSTVEQAEVASTLKNSLDADPGVAIRRIVDEANRTLTANGVLFASYPVSGGIRLGPYANRNGEAQASPGTLRHEFGHACSFIKRQIEASPGRPSSDHAARTFFDRYGFPCAINDERVRSAYGPLLKTLGADDNVELCLIDLAKKSTDPNSSAFIANSCPINKIEEATAEAFSLLSLKLQPDAYPQRACAMRPSKLHPASTDVFTCIVKGDARIRRRMMAAYACQESAQ